jgi:predicted nucleotidyltransferase
MVDIAAIKNSKSERKQQLQDELEHLLEQLKDFNILKVILFGSLIEDNIDINSDIDLLIIMPNSKSTKEWTNIIYETIERNIASDLIIFNFNDFKEMLPTSSFLQHIIETGKILYEET